MKKKPSIFKSTFVGVIVGAVGGLLFAPKSGKDIQADIKRKVKLTAEDIQSRLDSMNDEVTGRVDTLKEAAKDLKGEAKDESQELIKRAEVLKQDLRVSATNLSKRSGTAKDSTMKDVKLLLGEGSSVIDELERVTKLLVTSAKDKVEKAKTTPNDDKL
jgi:gas vesicle protein